MKEKKDQANKIPMGENGDTYEEKISSSGNVRTQEYRNKWGQLHRENDAPAKIVYKTMGVTGEKSPGIVKIEQWFTNGLRNRENGPAWVSYFPNGVVHEEEWWIDDKKERAEDKPAKISYHDNGTPFVKTWYFNNWIHREKNPAMISYREDGSTEEESWWNEGDLHREGAPARIYYDTQGELEAEWYNMRNKIESLYSDKTLEALINLVGIEGFHKNGNICGFLVNLLGEEEMAKLIEFK